MATDGGGGTNIVQTVVLVLGGLGGLGGFGGFVLSVIAFRHSWNSKGRDSNKPSSTDPPEGGTPA